jgi:hypothetical protein
MKGLFMRTEDELRLALSTRESLAPDAGPVLDGLGDAVRRRRGRLLTSCAAAATALVGVVVTVLAGPVLLAPAAPPSITTTAPTESPSSVSPGTTRDRHPIDTGRTPTRPRPVVAGVGGGR